ncbi:MAG: SHOCT domain-containing protein [Prevotella sp.]|nr:SHOCT domain-containing protein [Prevotella sp.]MBO5157244.1 SHOCT domain-containing protein [Prevotella sp.]
MVVVLVIVAFILLVIFVGVTDSNRRSGNKSFEENLSNSKDAVKYHDDAWHLGMIYDKERKKAKVINYDAKKFEEIDCPQLGPVAILTKSIAFSIGSHSTVIANLPQDKANFEIIKIDDFGADKILWNSKLTKFDSIPDACVALCSSLRKILFIEDANIPTKHMVVPFNDIISVEILENGSTTFSKSTTRTIGGALVGNVLMGGAGAVVGGLSGNTKKKDKVNSITVKILLRNLDIPTIILNIYKGSWIQTNGDKYKSFSEFANKIKDLLSVIIDSVDKVEKKTTKQSDTQQQTNITDELMKLAKLKESGALTDDEFTQMKAKLLNQ